MKFLFEANNFGNIQSYKFSRSWIKIGSDNRNANRLVDRSCADDVYQLRAEFMLLSCPNLSLFQAQQDFDCFLVVRFHVVAEAGRVLESSPAEAALQRTRCVFGGLKVEAGVGRLCHFL